MSDTCWIIKFTDDAQDLYLRYRPLTVTRLTSNINMCRVYATRTGAERALAHYGFPGEVLEARLSNPQNATDLYTVTLAA